MNNKQRKTLRKLISGEPGNNTRWADVESLFVGLGAAVEEGAGSRVIVTLGEHVAVFHRPHPEPTIRKGVAVAVRRFLEGAGVDHE